MSGEQVFSATPEDQPDLRYPIEWACRCSDGWFWIAASHEVFEPMTPDEIASYEAWDRARLAALRELMTDEDAADRGWS